MIIKVLGCIAASLLASASFADSVKLAVTTSFENSGLSDVLLPAMKDDLGLDVQLLVVGTGQALRLGQAGDVDALFVHSRRAEEKFVEDGFGTHRREIMYNDFVIVGPSADPVGIRSAQSVTEALAALAEAKPAYVSRGDDSGTHKKELSLWRAAGFDPGDFGSWYRKVGAGMGASLNTSAGLNAYTLADRASWLNFGNKDELNLLYAGDPNLFNQYAYIPVNPEKHGHVKYDLALQIEEWLTSSRAAELINGYAITGETLFTFNAVPGSLN